MISAGVISHSLTFYPDRKSLKIEARECTHRDPGRKSGNYSLSIPRIGPPMGRQVHVHVHAQSRIVLIFCFQEGRPQSRMLDQGDPRRGAPGAPGATTPRTATKQNCVSFLFSRWIASKQNCVIFLFSIWTEPPQDAQSRPKSRIVLVFCFQEGRLQSRFLRFLFWVFFLSFWPAVWSQSGGPAGLCDWFPAPASENIVKRNRSGRICIIRLAI